MVMPALRQFTVDDLEAFPPDGNRYEVLHGVLLVTPQAGLPHQTVAGRLAAALLTFLADEPGIEVWGPGAVELRPSTHLEPDILVGSMPRTAARWDAVQHHWLAVEVSGTDSRAYDRDYKRDGYLALGVQEVWQVDLDTRQIFVSRPDSKPDTPHDVRVVWRSPGGRDLAINIAALFRGIPARS